VLNGAIARVARAAIQRTRLRARISRRTTARNDTRSAPTGSNRPTSLVPFNKRSVTGTLRTGNTREAVWKPDTGTLGDGSGSAKLREPVQRPLPGKGRTRK